MEVFAINKFYGLCTSFGRNLRPVGSLDDVNNLVFNSKTLKPTLRNGYANDVTTYKCLSSAPTDRSGQTVLSSFQLPRGVHPATENLTAQDIQVIAGTDGSAGKHYFQRPFWSQGGVIDSTNWLRYGEVRETTITVAGSPTPVFTLAAGSASNDYYNGWTAYNVNRNTYTVISDYTGSTKAVIAYENIPTDWVSTDTVILVRDFHDNFYQSTDFPSGFSPSWTNPITVKIGNNHIACGGKGTTVGFKPIWSGYINQTFFSGSGLEPAVQRTYLSELELKNSNSWLDIITPTGTAETTAPLTDGRRWWLGYVVETFDGQRSNLIKASTAYVDITPSQKMIDTIYIRYPKMDKRMKIVHVFVAETSTDVTAEPDWADWFYMESHNMTSTGWTYTASSGAVSGYWSKAVDITMDDYNGADTETGDLITFLGHTKPTRTTVSFDHAVVTVGRLFTAKTYDYVNALSNLDTINYTPFAGNGVSQWSKLMDLDEQLQSTIEAGDPNSIQAILADDARLIILKNSGSFYIPVTYAPTQWALLDISRKIGCDAPESAVVTPMGVIWAKSGDGVYLWRNGEPIELTKNWRTSSVDYDGNALLTGFRSLATTYASSWVGWYNPFNRSFMLMFTSNGSTKTTVYECFLDTISLIPELNGLPIWTKHTMTHNVGHVLVRSDNYVFFSDDSTKTYVLSALSYTDGEATVGAGDGTAIAPYLDTGVYVFNEEVLSRFHDWWMAVKQIGTPVGTLSARIEVNAVQHNFASLTKTNTRFASKFPPVGSTGTGIRFIFNMNGTRATLGTQFTIHEIGFAFEPKKRAGLGQSL